MHNFNLERLKRLPLQSDAVWQGGWRELTGLEVGDQDPGTRFYVGMWVCTGGNVVGPGRDMLHTAETATAAKLLDLMVSFAADPQLMGYRPGTLEVADPGLADHLARELDGAGIRVIQVAEMPAWELATGDFESYLNKGPGGSASVSLFANPELSLDRIIRFGEAAAEFHAAAKWHEFSDQDLFRIVSPNGGPGLGCAVILGWAGVEYGIGFYDSEEEHDRLQSSASREAFMDRSGPLWFFTFNERREQGFRDLNAEWSRMGMPLATDDAYPLMLCHQPDTQPRTAGPRELDFITGLLLALARTETADAEQGRWTITVPVDDREVAYTLEMPYVLEPPGFAEILRWHNRPDPRSNEGLFEAMGTLLGESGDGDPAAVAKEFDDRFTGRDPDEIIAEANLLQTTARKADKYCFEAYDTVGFRKQILARQALAVDPSCIRAWNLLAEETSDLARRQEYYERAIAVAGDRFDLVAAREEWGDLDGKVEFRPALRALAGASSTAERLGRLDEALEYGLEFMNLSPADGPELRHFVVGRLLAQGRISDTERVLAQWPPRFMEPLTDRLDLDAETLMEFGGDNLFVPVANLILAAHGGAKDKELTRMRREIRALNRYVLPFLDKGKKPPHSSLGNLRLGGGAVAMLVGTELSEAWEKFCLK